MLEGSVRKAGNRIRITAQLIDAETGTHVWAERYDRALEDIFAVQDEITLILATEMQVNLTEGEQARLRYSSTSNVEAWNFWVQGLALCPHGVVTKDGVGKARVCWEKALALDPNSAPLHAMLGFVHFADARFGWWDDRETALAEVARAISTGRWSSTRQCRRAPLRRHAGQPRAPLRRFGCGRRLAVSLAPVRSTSPPSPQRCFACAGLHDEAIVQIEKAMRLSPNLPANYLGIQGHVYRLAGRSDDAIAAFRAYSRAQSRASGSPISRSCIESKQAGSTRRVGPPRSSQRRVRISPSHPGSGRKCGKMWSSTPPIWHRCGAQECRSSGDADPSTVLMPGLDPGIYSVTAQVATTATE